MTVDYNAMKDNIWPHNDSSGRATCSVTRISGGYRRNKGILYAGAFLLVGLQLLRITRPRLDSSSSSSSITGISTVSNVISKKERVMVATAAAATAAPVPLKQSYYISEKDRITASTKSSNQEYNCTLPSGEEVFLPRFPQFIIAGTMKGGTTMLSELFEKHPSLLRSRMVEAHFFDKHASLLSKINKNGSALTDSDICEMRLAYATDGFRLERLRKRPESLAFEKTPSYMAMPDVPQRIQVVAPWAKIIITLRNPAERAFSHFKMSMDRGMRTNLTFGEYFAKDLETLRRMECVPSPIRGRTSNTMENAAGDHGSLCSPPLRNIVYRGFYAQQLQNWIRQGYRLGKDLLVFPYERLKQEPTTIMNEIMEFADIPHHAFESHHLNKTYSPIKKRFALTLDPEARQLAQDFYAPYNEQLADLLGEEWRGLWS